MNVRPPDKRTFYIEKVGSAYKLLKVWEAGDPNAARDVQQYTMQRVMDSTADERIIAEQSVVVKSKNGRVTIEGEPSTVATAKTIAEIIIKDMTSGEA